MKKEYLKLKMACYSSNVSMSVVSNLSPILFITFRSLYGFSYSMLGLLVFLNFSTQLLVDLCFSFFSHKFNIPKAVRLMPVLCFLGLLVYAICPMLFPNNAYTYLLIGTAIFSSSCGLGEVLISPVIASIPADDSDREMSKLHSVYAWGVVGVVVVATLFLFCFGNENWYILVLVLSTIPVLSWILFLGAKIPLMKTPEKASGVVGLLKNKGVWLCIMAIFLGGAAECTMAQWASGYLEKALDIPKIWGDIFGVAFFAAFLGLGRSLYAKIGKNIHRVLLWGSFGATICYLLAIISPFPILGLFACAFTGFCVSMLWPGNLVVSTSRFPQGGVVVYALMAAGGDLGASVGPQLVGTITDAAMKNEKIISAAASLNMAPDQLGMKLGMLAGMIFPLFSVFLHWTSNGKADKKI